MPETTTTPTTALAPDAGMLSDWYDSYMKSQPTTQGYTAAQAGTTDWTPDANSTVQGQVKNIISENSPLQQLAETRSKEQMNARGLLNSSIAVGAGQTALYDAALPIAQQDASTFAKAGEFNAGAKNTASLANAGFSNDASKTSVDAANDALKQQRDAGVTSQQIEQQGKVQTGLQQGQQAFQASQAELDRGFTTSRDAQQFQNRLTEINAQTDAAIRQFDAENGTKLYDTYRTTSQQTYDAYLSAVQQVQTSDMEPAVKQAQIANLQQLFVTRQDFINTMFKEAPQWAEEWSQFEISFPNP